MALLFLIDNNLLALIISLVVLPTISGRLDLKDRSHNLFLALFVTNTLNLILDTTTTILEYQEETGFIILRTLMFVLFFLGSISLSYFWFLFVESWIPGEEKSRRFRRRLSAALWGVGVTFILTTPWTGLLFAVDPRYHRGPLYIAFVAADYTFLFWAAWNIFRRRDKVGASEFLSMAIFSFIPGTATAIQTIVPTLYIIWPSVAYALIVVFLHLQQRLSQMDRLTGAWEREKLFRHLEERLPKSERFALIFLDLDRFKEINDKFGHQEGDRALVKAVSMIRLCLRHGDFVVRYGGDEFVIYLAASSEAEVQSVIKRIDERFQQHNAEEVLYPLSFSFGWELHDGNHGSKAEELVRAADSKMYDHKRRRKEQCH